MWISGNGCMFYFYRGKWTGLYFSGVFRESVPRAREKKKKEKDSGIWKGN